MQSLCVLWERKEPGGLIQAKVTSILLRRGSKVNRGSRIPTFLPRKENRKRTPAPPPRRRHTSQPSSGFSSLLPLTFRPAKQLRARLKLALHTGGAHTAGQASAPLVQAGQGQRRSGTQMGVEGGSLSTSSPPCWAFHPCNWQSKNSTPELTPAAPSLGPPSHAPLQGAPYASTSLC